MKKTILTSAMILSALSFANDGNHSISKMVKKSNVGVKKVINTQLMNLEKRIIKDNLFISGRLEATKFVSTIFPYYEDSNYEIFLKPDYVTMIKLEANEDVLYIASGNSEMFMIDQTRGGRDGATYIYIKPLFEDVKTNFVITTDKRIYHLTLNTNDKYYNNKVSFEYPLDREIVSFKDETAIEKYDNSKKEDVKKEEDGIKFFGNLKLDYKITNDKYPFSPDIVYHDGVKTYIQMKKDLQEIPIFYTLNGKVEEQTPQRVTKVKGVNVFIIDKVVEGGRLRLGDKYVDFFKTK